MTAPQLEPAPIHPSPSSPAPSAAPGAAHQSPPAHHGTTRAGLQTIQIQGKLYVPVHERIRAFREQHPAWSILNDILLNEGGVVLMCCTIKDEHDRIIATAHASERHDSSYINRTSALENCETSAVGRALGMLGIGVDTALASAEEVTGAVQRQEAAAPPPRRSAHPAATAKETAQQQVEEARRLQLVKSVSAAFKQLDEAAQAAIRQQAGKSIRAMSIDELIALADAIREAQDDPLI